MREICQILLLSPLIVQLSFGGVMPPYVGGDDPKKLIEGIQNNPGRGSLRLQTVLAREAIQIDPEMVGSLILPPESVTLDPLLLTRIESTISNLQKYESAIPIGQAVAELFVEGGGVVATAGVASGGTAIVAGLTVIAATKAVGLIYDSVTQKLVSAENDILTNILADADNAEIERFKSDNGINRDTAIETFVSAKAAALFKTDLKDVPVESRVIIQQSLIQGLHTAVAQNKLDTLKQGVRIDNLEHAAVTLLDSVKTLETHHEVTAQRLAKVEKAQKAFEKKLEETSGNLEFTQELVFGTLPPAEQLKALHAKEKFLPNMDAGKRQELKLQIEAVLAKQNLTEAFSGTVDDINTVVGFASKLKLLSPEVVKVATQATRVATAGFNTVMSLASGNIFGALKSLGGLFGFSDPAEERHKQVMETLGKISETLGKISEQIAKSTEAILKGIELLMKQIDALDRKLDRYYSDLKKEHEKTQHYVLTLMRSVDAIINDKSSACSSILRQLEQFERWGEGLPGYESLYRNVLVNITGSSSAGDLWSRCDEHLSASFEKLLEGVFHENYLVSEAQATEGVANAHPSVRMDLAVKRAGFQAMTAFLKKYEETKKADKAELFRRLNLLLYPSVGYAGLSKKTQPEILAQIPSGDVGVFGQSPIKGAVAQPGLSDDLVLGMPLHSYRILRDAMAISRLHSLYELRTIGGSSGFASKLEDLVNQAATLRRGAQLLEQAMPHINASVVQQALVAGDAFLDWIDAGVDAYRADPKDEVGLLAVKAIQANPYLGSNYVRYYFAKRLRSIGQTYASVGPLFANLDGCKQLDRFLNVKESAVGPLFGVVDTATGADGKDTSSVCAMKFPEFHFPLPEVAVLRKEHFEFHPLIPALLDARHRVALEMSEYGLMNGFSKEEKKTVAQFLIRGLLKPGKESK